MESMQANPAQIKKFLKQLKNSQSQYVNYLGQLAYAEHQGGSLSSPNLRDTCVTLDDIAAQISKCEQDLVRIEQMKQAAKGPRCAYCGTPIAWGAPYCTNCRQPVAAPMPVAAPLPAAGKTCASCGGLLSADATFCSFCGKPAAADVPAAPLPPAAPPPPEVTAPAPGPTLAEAPPTIAPPTPLEAPAPASAPAPAPAPAPASLACPSCGKSYDDPDATFCTECGSKMH